MERMDTDDDLTSALPCHLEPRLAGLGFALAHFNGPDMDMGKPTPVRTASK